MSIKVNTLFKGMTRIPLVLGIPLVPLFFICALYILIAFAFNAVIYIIGLVPVILILRVVTKFDERIFNNLFLKIQFLSKSFQGNKMKNKGFKLNRFLKSKKIFKSFSLSPNSYRKNKSTESDNFDIDGVMDYSVHIPYSCHVADDIIMTQEGDLVATWELKGISFETLDDEILEANNNQLNQIYRSIASNKDNISFYYQKIKYDSDFELESTYNNPYAKVVDKLYKNQFKNKKFKKSSIYFSAVYRPINEIERRTIKQKSFEKNKKTYIDDFREIIEYLNEALKTEYQGRILTVKESERGFITSEALNYYNFLLTGKMQEIRIGNVPYYELIGDKRYFFVGNTLEIQDINTDRSRFSRCIEIKEYSENSYLGMFDNLQYENIDLIITHSFSTVNRRVAQSIVDKQQNRLMSGKDKASSQINDLDQLQDDITSGTIAAGKHHFSVFVFADSFEELVDKSNHVAQELQASGFITTFADVALPSAYFAQLPANFQYRPRLSVITSLNFANFTDMHNFYCGKKENNSWGEAITVLDTLSNQPLYFNFHEETMGNDFNEMNLGNTTFIGQSGTGKTLFLNFLLTQLQKFSQEESFSEDTLNKKATFFYLDKDFGAEANIKALGGKYLKIESGVPTGFNPFMLDNNEENIDFLFTLFKHIVISQNNVFTIRHQEQLHNAIKSVMDMPKENRINGVSRLLEFLPIGSSQKEIDEDLSTRLKQWTKGKKFGWVFDNETDELIFTDDIVNYGFDGTSFLENKNVSPYISYYLIYRMTKLLDGRRLVIFIDEFWQWINDPIFADFVYDRLKTIRKMNGLLVTATQSPYEVLKSDISAAILEQTETKIFSANPYGKEFEYCDIQADRRSFGCSLKEFYLIKNFGKTSRLLLIKKSNGSSIAKMNFSSLGKYLKVLSTSKVNSELLKELDVGTYKHPKYWLKEYLERSI